MKSWHARYHYQYYDQSGVPVAEGKFDYWWSTSNVSRISWTHGDQSHIEWHTSDGKELRSLIGNDIAGMEHMLISALIPKPLKIKDLQPGERQLKFFTVQDSSQQLACVGSVKTAIADSKIESLYSVWPAYCFTANDPVLIASHLNGTLTTRYGKVQKFQNHNFPIRIDISYAGAKRVEAELETLSEVAADDGAFTPSADATEYVPRTTTIHSPVISLGPLVVTRRVAPEYPIGARAAHIGGTVVVEATIDREGRIKDAHVLSSPDASLSAAALDAVRQWRYKPVVVNGRPMELGTKINVGFTP